MVTCSRCGAHIDPSALSCPYCRIQTPYGRQYAEQQAAHQLEAARASEATRAAADNARTLAIAKKSKHALFWALGGALTCCLPAALVGLFLGLSAKSLAKKQGAVPPATSTAAVVAGSLGVLLFAVGIATYIVDSRATDARISSLTAQIDGQRGAELLEQRVACGVVELELLQNGYAGKGGINIGDVQCDGKLEQAGESATLRDVRFRNGSDGKTTVTACLTRGTRWSVKELRDDGSCDPRVTPSVSGAAVPSRR